MKINLLTINDVESEEVERTFEALNRSKREAIASGDEDCANNRWRELEALDINCRFIRAFDHITNKRYRKAWEEFEKCEISCKSLEDNSTDEFVQRSRVSFIKRMVAQWQAIYPYCVFASPGIVIGYYTCSICGHKVRPRSRCSHRKGKVYWGELCVHVAHDVELKELSLVTTPVQKYSVVHNDETLDWSLIDHLSELLDHPFEEWKATWTTKKFPIERFSSVEQDDNCPCRSGAKFRSCCMDKAEVEIPHVDFTLNKNLSATQQGTRSPYDG